MANEKKNVKKPAAKKPAVKKTAPTLPLEEASTPPVEETEPPVVESAPVEESAPPVEAPVEEVVEAPVEAPAEAPPVVAKAIIPTTDELEEKALEDWWKSRNKPADINHFELSYSGVNLSKFGMLEAKVGKFRFTRSYVGANWQITVDEKK